MNPTQAQRAILHPVHDAYLLFPVERRTTEPPNRSEMAKAHSLLPSVLVYGAFLSTGEKHLMRAEHAGGTCGQNMRHPSVVWLSSPA